MQRKENPCALLVGTHIWAVTLENRMEMPQKIKNTNTMKVSVESDSV